MLTTMDNVPPNSTSPLPADWDQRNAESLFNLFAAGLTREPRISCAPGPAAFADLAPAGTLFPQVTPNYAYPGLSTAVLTPAPVSPLASQVYQVQQAVNQGLTDGRSDTLQGAVDNAGQSGASWDSGDWSDAAVVLPMSTTAGMILERTPPAQRPRRRAQSTDLPGVPWGGAPVRIPQGGCSQGLSTWAKLFLFAGAGVLVCAILNE